MEIGEHRQRSLGGAGAFHLLFMSHGLDTTDVPMYLQPFSSHNLDWPRYYSLAKEREGVAVFTQIDGPVRRVLLKLW